jgi:hypothetical protein
MPEDVNDFIYCHLTITGPAGTLKSFAAAASGPGVIPWQLDFDAIEEDIFNLAVTQPPAQRDLTVAGCRLLARQFRARIEARQAKAATLIGTSHACPFDLQILLPVPDEILSLGPTHPPSAICRAASASSSRSPSSRSALPSASPGRACSPSSWGSPRRSPCITGRPSSPPSFPRRPVFISSAD